MAWIIEEDIMAYLFGDEKQKVDFDSAMQSILSPLETTYQSNINTIYNALVAQGVTPSSKLPSDIATAISTLATNKYNSGRTQGRADKSSHTLKLKLNCQIDGGGGWLHYAILYVDGSEFARAFAGPTSEYQFTAYTNYTNGLTK